MNIAVVVMTANKQPSIRNVEAFKEYVVKDCLKLKNENKLEHNYDFIFYYGDKSSTTNISKLDDHIYEVHCCTEDDIYSTYEKTIECFKKLDEINNFDIVVRINISLFLNIRLLDKLANTIDLNNVYCNAINGILEGPYANQIYPRGDFYITGKQLIDKIINVSDKFYINRNDLAGYDKVFNLKTDHVDDVLFGCSLADVLGKGYHNHIKMIYYNLLMQTINEDEDVSKLLNKHIIATRLKTTPPGQLSGYSWDDNDYRLNDIVKFKKCYEYFSQFEYEKGITINHLCVDESNSRPVTIVQLQNVQVKDIKNYLNKKELTN